MNKTRKNKKPVTQVIGEYFLLGVMALAWVAIIGVGMHLTHPF